MCSGTSNYSWVTILNIEISVTRAGGRAPRPLSIQNFQKNRFFQNQSAFNPDNNKWKDATWWGYFAPKKVWTLLLHWGWKIKFWPKNWVPSGIFFTPLKQHFFDFFDIFRQSDQNKSFQCPISLPKGNLMSLNTFLTLFWYFIHFSDP